MNIFKDMLTEKGKYSQGRVYLFWAILAYYVTLAILTVAGIRKSDIEMGKFELIINALEYAMTLFAGYVFGGKFIDVIKVLNGRKKKEDTNETQLLNE